MSKSASYFCAVFRAWFAEEDLTRPQQSVGEEDASQSLPEGATGQKQ